MQNKGLALMGTGTARGENRAIEAATQAISSPLLENVKINGATGIIINVTGGPDLSLYEVNEAAQLIIDSASEDAEVIFGAVIDNTLTDEIRVTVIATGFNHEEKREGIMPHQNMQNFLQQQPGAQFPPQFAVAGQPQYQQPGYQQQAQAPVAHPFPQQQPAVPAFHQPAVQPAMPQVMMPPAPAVTLPSIDNVQESVKTFTHEPVESFEAPAIEAAPEENLTAEVSPVATTTASVTTARDMLLAKAKAFRETQISQVVAPEKGIHPEQLSMMDEERQFEDARRMARDILEVPAFIRKKQGVDLQ
jgi:cell division protein FtsZ